MMRNLWRLNTVGLSALALALVMFIALSAGAEGTYDLEFRDADVKDILRLLGDQEGINILISDDVSGNVTASFRGVTFEEILGSVLRMNDLKAVQDGSILRVESRAAMVTRGETLSNRLYHLNFAEAAQLAKTVGKALTSDGTVNVDARTNSLLVRDTEDSLLELAGLIEELDRPTPQVMIEARIVEATTNFARQLGIRWGFDYSRTGTVNQIDISGTDTGNSLVNLPSTTVYGGIGISYATLSGTFDLDLELTAMEDKGWGKIVSSPKIATLENNEAVIKSGVKIPVQQVTVQDGVGTTETDFVEAVLSLRVRPQVTSQGRIILDIAADRSVPDFGRVVDGFPTILTREAKTRVMVKDGETVVIGGLLQETEGEDTSRVPIISDIPIIGGLFKSKRKTLDTEELLIFITPKLITL